MIRSDFHIHTVLCDGKNRPEEMVCDAIAAGLEEIGFSGHSNTPFDESWCMTKNATEQYRKEIALLKEKYAGQIRIFCGIEQDYYSDAPTDAYDYVIGSVHYLKLNGEYVPVDESPEILRAAADRFFGGDLYALAGAYYETVSGVAEKTGCDIIGHFDLISKFNDRRPKLFREKDSRYTAAWKPAADVLLTKGIPFEINTGAISRGYKKTPYPSGDMISYLAGNGAHFLLSSDSHSVGTLAFQFEKWEQYAKELGAAVEPFAPKAAKRCTE